MITRLVPGPQYLAIATASAKFTNAMESGKQYRFSTTTDCFVLVGATGASATAGAGSHLVCAGQSIPLAIAPGEDTTNGFVHVIRNTADGKGTLSVVETVE